MANIKYRRRGTAIVETKKGILLVASNPVKGPFILPGGGANRGESRFIAALRELTEETGMLPYAGEILFKHLGRSRPTMSGRGLYQDHHTVCLIKTTGVPTPHDDAKRMDFYYPGCHIWVSKETQEILDRYFEWKNKMQKGISERVTDDDSDSGEDVAQGDAPDATTYDSDEVQQL